MLFSQKSCMGVLTGALVTTRDSCRSDRVCPSVFGARFQRTAPCRRHTERLDLPSEQLIISEWFGLNSPRFVKTHLGQYVRVLDGSPPLSVTRPVVGVNKKVVLRLLCNIHLYTCCFVCFHTQTIVQCAVIRGYGLTTDTSISLFGLHKENVVNSNVTSFLAPKSRLPR